MTIALVEHSVFGSAVPSVSIADPDDISDWVAYLASDVPRALVGIRLAVDIGATKI